MMGKRSQPGAQPEGCCSSVLQGTQPLQDYKHGHEGCPLCWQQEQDGKGKSRDPCGLGIMSARTKNCKRNWQGQGAKAGEES